MPGAKDWEIRAWRFRWRTAPRLASHVRIAVARLTHRHATVRIPWTAYAGPGFRLEIPAGGSFVVGDGVMFRRGFYCEVAGDGAVSIGAGTQFGGPTTIQCSTEVAIGEKCLFAASVLIADGAHRFRDWQQPIHAQGYTYRKVRIGPGALVHAHATIVADVGRHAVVGANSLVNKDVPPNALVGGVPATLIEQFGPSDGAVAADA